MEQTACKKHNPPCPDYCTVHKRKGKKFCREIPKFTSKTKFSKIQVINKFKYYLNPLNDFNKILSEPKVITYINFRNNLTDEEIVLLPKIIKLIMNDIKNNVYNVEALKEAFSFINFKQYIRNENNKPISNDELDYVFNLFNLKGFTKYEKAPELIPDLEALKLLEILLLDEKDFITKFIKSELVPVPTPIKVKEKKKKLQEAPTKLAPMPVFPQPVVEPSTKLVGDSKKSVKPGHYIELMMKAKKEQQKQKPIEPKEEQWGQRINNKQREENYRSEAKELEEEMEIQDFDERPQSPQPINTNESRTYRALKTVAEMYKINLDKFEKFANLLRTKYYIRLRDRIKTDDLKIVRAQYDSVKEDIESYDYNTNSNVRSLDPNKQYVIRKIVSSLPLCSFIRDGNGEPASTGDLNRYAENLGIGMIDALPKEIKCFLILREITKNELEVLSQNFKEISYK